MTAQANDVDDERVLGPIEQSVADELEWIRERSEAEWPDTTELLALKLARAIDENPATDGFRLPSMIGKLNDQLDRLAESAAPTQAATPALDFSDLLKPTK